jgi:molybdopterin synthase catalytic subunit
MRLLELDSQAWPGREVTRLEYEAYEQLALKVMAGVLDEARQLALEGAFATPSPTASLRLPTDTSPTPSSPRPLLRLALAHRLGEVPPLQTSIFIAVSSAHRRESFAACEWMLEAVKRRVPIWKREWYAGEREPVIAGDGQQPSARWKENFDVGHERDL